MCQAPGCRGPPLLRIHTVGDHGQSVVRNPQPGQHIGLKLGKHDHSVVARQSGRIELIGELLGACCEITKAGIKRRMEGGHQGNTQLLAQLRQAEIQRREGEAGVHQIGLKAFQRLPQFPLGPGRGNGVNLRLHQVRKAHIGVIGKQRGGAAAGGSRVVKMNEAGLVTASAKGLRGAQPVGDVAAER